MASRSVYCVCGQTYDSERFMIQCDACKDWYHGSCVNIKEHESLDIEKYHCVQCQESYGASVYREIKNWHRHDYADTQAEGKAVQSGTPMFVKELRTRHFKNGDDIVLRLRGPLLNLPYLIQHGFNFPILVDSKVGLGLQIPSDTFTVSDVLDYIGPDFQLDVIDVTRQDSIKMSMKEWVEYYNCSVRNKVYNVISLEFSKTKLAELVKPPTIVQKLSWVENYWPKTLPDSYDTPRPEVMKYCLMSTEDSYTDFHIDFGGTSVWYHILRGEKLFFLIRPTPANLALYEHWSASTNHSETFFGDQVDACYQLVLTQGQTLFIPTGWIHSVFTPVDSLVFGGNFLSSLNIPLQLQIFEMEKRIKTPEKFKFPTFEAVHWFAAPHILEILRDFNVSKREAQHLIAGVKALISALKMWSSDSQNHKHDDIPPDINVPRLIKDLQREVRTAEKFSIGKNAATLAKKPPARQRKPKDLNQSMERSEPKPSSQFSVVEEPSNFQFGMSSMNILAQQPQMDPSVHLNVPQITSESVLKNFALSPAMAPHLLNAISMKGGSLADRNELYNLAILAAENSKCKDEMGMAMKNESVYDFVDSDDDNLVVDENPPAKKHRNMELVKMSRNMQDLSSEARQGAIKLRFSFNGKTVDDELSMFKQSLLQNANVNSYVEPPKNATLDDLLMATELAEDADNSINLDEDDLSGGRTSPSTREAIQGMLSISKSAFLFTNQGDGNNQMVIPQQYSMPPTVPPSSSSSMGSLSLAESSVANFSILAKKSSPQARSNSYNLSKPKLARRRYRNEDDDDFEESLKQCHQDSDYIYLGLEASDEEFHVFKPRGKNRRDEAWNPKAKLVPNCPKPERPVREGVRKEAIETGLAAAAAKLATMPPPKRQYLKKKTPTKKKETTSLQHGNAGPSFSSKKPVASDPIKSNKKPKKGFATPKQRLGKILKIHKMLY